MALLVDTSFLIVVGEPLVADEAHRARAQPSDLDALRSDALQIAAFGRYARTVTAAELAGLEGV